MLDVVNGLSSALFKSIVFLFLGYWIHVEFFDASWVCLTRLDAGVWG